MHRGVIIRRLIIWNLITALVEFLGRQISRLDVEGEKQRGIDRDERKLQLAKRSHPVSWNSSEPAAISRKSGKRESKV
jgi:hypothetical protein